MAHHAWTYIAYSVVASCLGTFVIWTDKVWNRLFPRRSFSILEDQRFLIDALSISCGTLLTTAMYKLLPESLAYIAKSDKIGDQQSVHMIVFAAFTTGIALCWVLNAAIHYLTAASIVHCAHDVAEQRSSSSSIDPLETTPLRHSTHQHYSVDRSGANGPEETPPMLLKATSSLLRCRCEDVGHSGTCRGFSSVSQCEHDVNDSQCACPDESYAPFDNRLGDCPPELEDPETHHHHVTTKFGQLFSIGLQTALAISLHKVPEGFLMYATNQADRSVGFQVFVALIVHNFTEGFAMTTPLYIALKSRTLATLVALLLGGGSQPLGALAAQMTLGSKPLDISMFLEFGIGVAATSGIMATIGLQMITTASAYGGDQRTVVSWAMIGMVLVLLLDCL